MKIIEATGYREQFLETINKLLPQLSADAKPLCKADLEQIIKSPATVLFFSANNHQFLGTLTLVLFQTPVGSRARIEDFIVDRDVRRQGIGKQLIDHAIRHARQYGAKTIDLTSHPSRHAANDLYQKTGFKIKKTNVYHYKLAITEK